MHSESLEVLKAQPGTALSNLLQLTLLWAALGLGYLQPEHSCGSVTVQVIDVFCDRKSNKLYQQTLLLKELD